MQNTAIPLNLNNIRCYIHFFGPVTSESSVPLFVMPAAGEVPNYHHMYWLLLKQKIGTTIYHHGLLRLLGASRKNVTYV